MTKDMLQVTNYTVFDCLSSQSRQRGVIPSVRDQERHALFFDKFYQVVGFRGFERHRLLTQNGKTPFQRGDGVFIVKAVRRTDDHPVHIPSA